jgi:hypothetical protein
MKLMRNTRTGRQAVYDETLVATGNWELVEDAPKPTAKKPKPEKQDFVKAGDEVQITLTRSSGESIEHQA